MLKLVETRGGNFNISNFGARIAGKNGENKFDLEISSADRTINVMVNGITIHQLFTKMDTTGRDFSIDRYSSTNFIKASSGKDAIAFKTSRAVVEMFKESYKKGVVVNNSSKKIVMIGARGSVFILPVTKEMTGKAA